MELGARSAARLAEEARVLVIRQPLHHVRLGSPLPHHRCSLSELRPPLCSLAPSAPFPQGSGMAAIALIHKVFQFRNLKELSSKLLSLCDPPPHSHLCVPRVGPLCGPSPAQRRPRRREEPVEMWWILEESAVGVRASPEKSFKTQ